MKELKYVHKLIFFVSSLSPMFLYLVYKKFDLSLGLKNWYSFAFLLIALLSISAFFFYIRRKRKADDEVKIKSYENLTASKTKEILPFVIYLIGAELFTQTLIVSSVFVVYYLYLYFKDNQILLMNPLLIISGLNVLKISDFHDNKYILLCRNKKLMKKEIIEINYISGELTRKWN